MDFHQVKVSLLVKLSTHTKINRSKVPQGIFPGEKSFNFCVLVIKERIKHGLNRFLHVRWKCIKSLLMFFC
jgi:hypothetical protein